MIGISAGILSKLTLSKYFNSSTYIFWLTAVRMSFRKCETNTFFLAKSLSASWGITNVFVKY